MPLVNETFASQQIDVSVPEGAAVPGVLITFFVGGDRENALIAKQTFLEAASAKAIGQSLIEQGDEALNAQKIVVAPAGSEKAAADALRAAQNGHGG